MILETPNCPQCNERARGTIETVNGCAEFNWRDDGTAEYSGNTAIWWDEQMTEVVDGRCALICQNGHEWLSRRTDPTSGAEEKWSPDQPATEKEHDPQTASSVLDQDEPIP